jgi:hypothetical protein
MDLYETVDWIHLAQNNVHLWTVVVTLMNVWFT